MGNRVSMIIADNFSILSSGLPFWASFKNTMCFHVYWPLYLFINIQLWNDSYCVYLKTDYNGSFCTGSKYLSESSGHLQLFLEVVDPASYPAFEFRGFIIVGKVILHEKQCIHRLIESSISIINGSRVIVSCQDSFATIKMHYASCGSIRSFVFPITVFLPKLTNPVLSIWPLLLYHAKRPCGICSSLSR